MPTNAEVAAWLAANPTATDADIAAAMDTYGVSSQQLSEVTGISKSEIDSRYNAVLQNVLSNPNIVRGPAALEGLSEEAVQASRPGLFTGSTVGTRTSLGDDIQTYEAVGGPDKQGYTTYQVSDAYGNPTDLIKVHTDPTAKDVWEGAAPVVLGALSAGLAGPLTSALTPTLGAVGAPAATGAILGSGSSLLSGGNTEDILKAGVLGGVVGATQGYFSPSITPTDVIDTAVNDLVQAYTDAGLPVNYDAIERSLVAQGFNTIDAGAAVDLAKGATTVVPAAVDTTGQVVNVTGSNLANTSVLEAVGLVPVGTLAPVLGPATTTPVTPERKVEVVDKKETPVVIPPVTPVPTTPTYTPPNVEVTQSKEDTTQVPVVVPPVVSVPTTPTYTPPNVEVTKPKEDTPQIPVVVPPIVTTPVVNPSVYDPTKEVEVTPKDDDTKVITPPPSVPPTDLGVIPTETNVTTPVVDDPKLVKIDEGPGGLPSWLTPDLVKALLTLGMFGGTTGTGGTGTTGPGALPTQGVPTPTSDYYNQVQKYYNQYMPGMPRDVATPLQTWYGGSLFNMPTNIPASPTKTTNTGALTPNIDTQAIIDFLNKYATQQP